MLGMALRRVPCAGMGESLSSWPSLSLSLCAHPAASHALGPMCRENHHLQPQCQLLSAGGDPPGGNQGGDSPSPFLSMKYFGGEVTGVPWGLWQPWSYKTAKKVPGKHHFSETKALEGTGGERWQGLISMPHPRPVTPPPLPQGATFLETRILNTFHASD